MCVLHWHAVSPPFLLLHPAENEWTNGGWRTSSRSSPWCAGGSTVQSTPQNTKTGLLNFDPNVIRPLPLVQNSWMPRRSTSKTKPDTKGRWYIADCVPNPTPRLHAHQEVETFQEAAVYRQSNRKLSEQPATIFLRPDFNNFIILVFFPLCFFLLFSPPLWTLIYSVPSVWTHPFQCPTFGIISSQLPPPDLHHYPKQSGCLCHA